MPNTLKILLGENMRIGVYFLLCLLALNPLGAATVNGGANRHATCTKEVRESVEQISSYACYADQSYRLQYDSKSGRVVLFFDKTHVDLHRIPRRYDPSLVGADNIIGFLPAELQPYLSKDIILYISSIRTTGGGGGGQCGSGSEIYLNFLDVRPRLPTLRSSILIGSCAQSIELLDQDIPAGKFGAISVANNKLSLHFMNYGNLEGYPTATVSADFKQLEF
jgi:hypothetical protein